jgi:hypothetical protein
MTTQTVMNWMSGEATSAPHVAGQLFVIRCIPDVFTGEILNIGVCAIDATGRRFAKVITEPGRLSCLYGESAHQIVDMAAIAKDAAEAGCQSPSNQIIFDIPTPYYGAKITIKEAAETAFADQITVALPQRETNALERIDDEQATDRVINELKKSIGMNMELIANTPQILIQTKMGPRAVRVPLQPKNGAGTIRSAYYSPQSLKTHLMDSVLDMEFAARSREKQHTGLFILRPTTKDKKLNASIDSVIDNVAYRSPKFMTLEVETTPSDLAARINKWHEMAA